MRIAFVVGTFPELSETFILDQLTGLLDLGHDVVVFGRAPANDAATHPVVRDYALLERARHWSGGARTPVDLLARTAQLLVGQPRRAAMVLARCLDVVEHGSSALNGTLWMRASSVLQERLPFDVILAHFGTNGLIAQQLRDVGALSGPLVTIFHGHDLSKQLALHGSNMYERLFQRGQLMLPVSAFFARRLLELGCPPAHVQVQRMGVDTKRFAFLERHRAAGEPVRVISVCRLVEKKGLEYGLRAVAEARKRSDVAFEWDIVGDGPLRASLERLAGELQLGGCVHFHGARTRDDVQQRLRGAHLFFAPSVTSRDGDQEGVPVAIMEAAACGMPILSTRHSGIPELVQDGVTGLLADERNVDELAAQLTVLLGASSRWATMGRAGRAIVERDFDLTTLNRTLESRLAQQLLR